MKRAREVFSWSFSNQRPLCFIFESVRIKYPADGSQCDVVLENNLGAKKRVCCGARGCSKNSACGKGNWIGDAYCKPEKKDVYQSFTTGACLFPGTAKSACEAEEKMKEPCPPGKPCVAGKCGAALAISSALSKATLPGRRGAGPTLKNCTRISPSSAATTVHASSAA